MPVGNFTKRAKIFRTFVHFSIGLIILRSPLLPLFPVSTKLGIRPCF